MSSGSGLKGAFISFVVLGAIGMLIRYLFGRDSNRSAIHEIFETVLNIFWWAARYLLIPFIIFIIIGMVIQENQKNK